MRRTLPPLNPLRFFEVAARHESFTKAADELRVSQAAVSRQVSVLEAYLNTQLFRRRNREVKLTDVGAQYARAATQAFDVIERGTEELPVAGRHVPSLHVRVYTSFALNWLIPRLGRFYAKHPEVRLELGTSVEDVDLNKDDVDLWIHFGRVSHSDLIVEPFLHDVLQPAVSPRLLRNKMPKDIKFLSELTLLQTVRRPRDWATWLHHATNGNVKPKRIEVFENSALAYEAAVEGLGFTMAQLPLIERHVGAGRLVPLFKPLIRPNTHHSVYRTARKDFRPLRTFCSWITAEAAKSMLEHCPNDSNA
jgi:LysR family glycine cleavage system transcriptional activator